MLLNSKDLMKIETEPDNEIAPYRTSGSNRFGMGTIGRELRDIIGDLQQNESIHIPTRGVWSNHNLLDYVLQQTGPARVWLTSWTISEIAVRTLLQLIDSGTIVEVNCLFDERIKVQCPQAYQLVDKSGVMLKLTKIHAKSIVVLNDEWGVSVTTSANFTRNPRIEKYVVCTDRQIAEKDKEWIQQEIDNGRPFEMDVYD